MDSLFINSIKNSIKHWYIPLIVGILFIVVSVVAFTSPLGSLLTLSLLFSLSLIFGGLSEVVFSVVNRNQMSNWGWSMVFGIITMIVGFLLFSNPAISIISLSFYVGFIILFRSISAISFALDIKKYGSKSWGGLLVLGILGAIFSFLLLWNPIFAGLSVVILIALSFLSAGLFSIYYSLQLRKIHKLSKDISPKIQERIDQIKRDLEQEWNTDSRKNIY